MNRGSLRRPSDGKAAEMLRIYMMPNGHSYQYEEGQEPEGAVLVEAKEEKAAEPVDKTVKPANKARKAATK